MNSILSFLLGLIICFASCRTSDNSNSAANDHLRLPALEPGPYNASEILTAQLMCVIGIDSVVKRGTFDDGHVDTLALFYCDQDNRVHIHQRSLNAKKREAMYYWMMYRFSKEGYLQEHGEYLYEKPAYVTIFEYDNSMNVIRELQKNYFDPNDIPDTVYRTYGKNNELLSIRHVYADEKDARTETIEYLQANGECCGDELTIHGITRDCITYVNGRKSKVRRLYMDDKNSKPDITSTIIYRPDGKIESSITYFPGDVDPSDVEKYEYDEWGRLIKLDSKDDKLYDILSIISYDDRGFIQREDYSESMHGKHVTFDYIVIK